jgi:uncharacterized tellurite resistance protein B-like protein
MFDAFRKFLSDCTNGDKHPSRFADDDYRLAASALLVHAAAIDGEVSQVERDQLHDVIKRRFELDEAATNELMIEATQAEQQAIDLYHFTSLINRSLDEVGRRRIVEMMWEIVYADGRVTEFRGQPALAGGGFARHLLPGSDRIAPSRCRRACARRPGRVKTPWRTCAPSR